MGPLDGPLEVVGQVVVTAPIRDFAGEHLVRDAEDVPRRVVRQEVKTDTDGTEDDNYPLSCVVCRQRDEVCGLPVINEEEGQLVVEGRDRV